MPRLDLFTIQLFTLITVLVAGAAMQLVSTVNKRTPGVKRCALACFVMILGMGLYSGRLFFPGKLILFLPNPVVIVATLILLDGVRAFRGLPQRRGWMAAGLAAFASAQWFWLYVRDDINARTVAHLAALAICCGALTWAMAARVTARDRAVYWSTAAGFAVYGLAAVAKGCDALWGPTVQLWVGRPVDFVFIAATNVCICGCAFGLSMAVNLKLQRETEVLALYDPLTRLPNRRHFEEQLEGAEQRASGPGWRIALIYCDVDNFKGINDQLGHEGGDSALRLVGQRLRAMAGNGSSVARVGGDEFLLLVEDAPSRDRLHALVEDLRKAVDGEFEFRGHTVTINISCGLSVYPDDVGSVSDLIRLADAAMYMMKQRGRAVPLTSAAAAGRA